MYIISYYVASETNDLHYIVWKFVKTKYKYACNTWSDGETLKKFNNINYLPRAPAPFNTADKLYKIKCKTKEDVITELTMLHIQYGGTFKGIKYL